MSVSTFSVQSIASSGNQRILNFMRAMAAGDKLRTRLSKNIFLIS